MCLCFAAHRGGGAVFPSSSSSASKWWRPPTTRAGGCACEGSVNWLWRGALALAPRGGPCAEADGDTDMASLTLLPGRPSPPPAAPGARRPALPAGDPPPAAPATPTAPATPVGPFFPAWPACLFVRPSARGGAWLRELVGALGHDGEVRVRVGVGVPGSNGKAGRPGGRTCGARRCDSGLR